MEDKYITWFAENLDKAQKRFANMIIEDIKKFSVSSGYNKEYRDFLINKYEEYLKH